MKRFLLMLTPFLFPVMLMAQQKRITGNIINRNTGQGMEGVTIKARNTTVVSKVDGSFSLDVVAGETLVVSYVGFTTQNIKVGNSLTKISVEMTPAEGAMDAVVVTGYSTEKKRDLIGAISVVSMNDVKNIPVGSPIQSLQGRVPGMNITKDGTPGGGTRSVLIRGINTLGNNDPLYIVDGQPVDSKVMDRMDPNDIESLQVLKDAASASIYGSRASNGVIILTTKKGKGNKIRVDVNSSFATQDYATHLQMLDTDQRGRALWRASVNDGTNPSTDNTQYKFVWHREANGTPVLDNMTVNEYLDPTIQGGIKSGNTDWFNEISRPGNLIRNNISLSSAGETHSLFMSVGQLSNKGIVKYTDYNQLTFRLNTSFTMLKGKMKVGENLQVAVGKQTPIGSGPGRYTA
jgi:TonB-dependent SusC/RagA subfamily outer membrane receptor